MTASVTELGRGRGAFIGGSWSEGGGERIGVTNPATGEEIGAVTAATGAQVDAAVAAAATAFESWRRTSVLERAELCRAAHRLCLERVEQISATIAAEVGKTVASARSEMEGGTAEHFRRAAEDALRQRGQVLQSTMDMVTAKKVVVVQQPVGVVAAISPWNFPVDIAAIPIIYGLALGCTAVWKPSEHAPLCAEMFVEIFADAGFPEGTVNLVHGRGETGAQLVRTRMSRRRLHRLGRHRGGRRQGGRPAKPGARARRQRAADRARGRRHRARGGCRGARVLLPRGPVLHRRRAPARAQVGQG